VKLHNFIFNVVIGFICFLPHSIVMAERDGIECHEGMKDNDYVFTGSIK